MKKWKSLTAVALAALICGCPGTSNSPRPVASDGDRTSLPPPDHIDVVIEGVSCFYLADANNPVLLIVKDPGGLHKPTVTVPQADPAALKTAFNKKNCTTGCDLPAVGLRITDGGTAFTGPMTVNAGMAQMFDEAVTHLQRDIDPNFKTFDDFTAAGKIATKPPKAGSAVHAFLDLRGAEVVAVTPFLCKGKSAPNDCNINIAARRWAESVTVRYKTANPELTVIRPAGDLPVKFVNFNGTSMTISNLAKPPAPGQLGTSHVHLFKGLTHDKVCLPEVEATNECDTPNDVQPDFVPGCGNTQWP